MNIEKNYLESNWIFDILIIIGFISLFVLSFYIDEDQALFLFFSILLFLIFLFKIVYYWRKITELKTVINHSSVDNPEPVYKIDFYDLNISIKEDLSTLDIFKGRQLEHSFKKKELDKLPETAFLIILKTQWRNWNWSWKSRYLDNYFQLILQTGNETREIVRIRESVYKRIEYPVNTESFYELAHALSNKMKVKIKDSAQQ